MKRLFLYPASLAALAAALLLACGNGDDDDDNTPDAGSKADSGTTITPTKDSGTTPITTVDSGTTTKDSGTTPTTDSGTTPDAGPTDGGTDASDSGTLEPTFTNVYATVINGTCTGCHAPGGSGVSGGKLDMSSQATAYTDLVGVTSTGSACGTSGDKRVVASDSANSLLWQKINHTNTCGSGMPLEGAMLSAEKIDLVAAWINAGALND